MTIEITEYQGSLQHLAWDYWGDGYIEIVKGREIWTVILGAIKKEPGKPQELIELERRKGYRSEKMADIGDASMEKKWNKKFLRSRSRGVTIYPPGKLATKVSGRGWISVWPEYYMPANKEELQFLNPKPRRP